MDSRKDIPKHVKEEANKATVWRAGAGVSALLVWGTVISMAPLVEWTTSRALDIHTVQSIATYLSGLWPNPFAHARYWFEQGGGIYSSSRGPQSDSWPGGASGSPCTAHARTAGR